MVRTPTEPTADKASEQEVITKQIKQFKNRGGVIHIAPEIKTPPISATVQIKEY